MAGLIAADRHALWKIGFARDKLCGVPDARGGVEMATVFSRGCESRTAKVFLSPLGGNKCSNRATEARRNYGEGNVA